MRYSIFTILFLLNIKCWPSSFVPVYPYIQKTEGGKVKCYSVPYGVHDGPYGPGQSFIYYENKLLYTIDKYFLNNFYSSNKGEYIIEFDFSLNYKLPDLILKDGKKTLEQLELDGDAIRIFKYGEPFRTIRFSELKIDTSKLTIYKYGTFVWKFEVKDSLKNKLKNKMENHSSFVSGDTLFLITSDNQLLSIQISSGIIINRQNAYETLKLRNQWNPEKVKRKYKHPKYPNKFSLPKLKNGITLEKALAELLNQKTCDQARDSALTQIYFHTLLINSQGKCELVYVRPARRSDIKNEFDGEDSELESKIEKWILESIFDTKTIPNDFLKFKYTSFVYLK